MTKINYVSPSSEPETFQITIVDPSQTGTMQALGITVERFDEIMEEVVRITKEKPMRPHELLAQIKFKSLNELAAFGILVGMEAKLYNQKQTSDARTTSNRTIN